MQFHFDLFIPYGIPPLLSVLVALFLASLTIKAGKYNKENQLFTLFCIFQLLASLVDVLDTLWLLPDHSLLSSRLLALVYQFIIPVSIHFVHTVLGIQRRKWLLWGGYVLITVLTPLTLTSWHVSEKQKVFFGYISRTGSLYQILTLLGLATLIYCGMLLAQALRTEIRPDQRVKIRFIFLGLFFSGMLSVVDALFKVSGFSLYPLANFGFIPLSLMAYGLLQYNLMEIAKEWFSHGYLSKILGFLAWWPLALALLFYLLAPSDLFYPNFIARIVPYTIPQIISMLICYSLASFCFFQGNYRMDTLLFGALCWLWGGLNLDVTLMALVKDAPLALSLSRMDHFFLVNQLGVYAGFLYYFAGVDKKWVFLFGLVGTLLMPFTLTEWYFQGMYHYYWGFFAKKNIVFDLFSIITLIEALWVVITLFKKSNRTLAPDQRKAYLYFIIGGIGAGLLSLTDVPAMNGLEVYPLGNFMFIPILIMAVGVFRYDLIQISAYRKEVALRQMALLMLGLVYSMLLILAWKGLPEHSFDEVSRKILPYGIPPLLSLLICLFFSMAALRVGRLKPELILFSFSCVLFALLNLDILLLGIVNTPEQALNLSRTDHLFVIFIPVIQLHLALIISRISRMKTLILSYLGTLLFFPITQTAYYFQGVLRYDWGFFSQRNIGFDFFSLFAVILVSLGIYFIFKSYRQEADSSRKRRLLYFFWSEIVLIFLNLGNMPALYGVELYPLGNFTFLPILIQGYALLQYYKASVFHLCRKTLHYGVLLGVIVTVSFFLERTSIPQPVIILGFLLGFRLLDRLVTRLLSLVFPTERLQWKQILQDLHIKLSIALTQQSVEQTMIPHLLHTLENRKCWLFFSDKKALSYQGTLYVAPDRSQGFTQTTYQPEDSFRIEADHPLVQMLYETQDLVSSDQRDEWFRSHEIPLNAESVFSKSVLLQPVFFHGALSCFIALEEKQNEQLYSIEEQEFLRTIATSLGPVIENIRLITSLEERVQERTLNLQKARDQLSLINTISQKVGLSHNLKDAFQIFIKDVILCLDREASGSIFIYEESSEKLVYLDSYQLQEEIAKTFRIKVAQESSYAYIVFQTQQSFLVNGEQIHNYLSEELLQMHYGKIPAEQLILPLLSEGKVAGIINLTHYDPQRRLQSDEQLFLQGLTRNLSHHFEMILHVEQIQEREQEIKAAHQEIQLINQVVQIVNSTLDLDTLVKQIMTVLQQIFKFNGLAIALLDESRRNLVFHAAYHDGSWLADEGKWKALVIPVTQDNNFFVKTLKYNDPNYIACITPKMLEYFDEYDRQLYEIFPTESVLFCPLSFHGEAIGVINFGNSRKPFDLVESDIVRIQLYVNQISNAIYNAQQYEALKATKIQLAESAKITAMTRTFEKFVPKQFLNRIAQDGLDSIELGKGQSATITIMFSDIRSFTELSETMTAQDLMNFLNTYLQKMSDPIHQYGGFVDKFIGDAIMALFDFPDNSKAEETESALRAAIAMQEILKVYNQHRIECGYLPIVSGIGIHRGSVVIGTLGSQDRMDSTVIGDTVNIASRLEGLTKYYGSKILISYDTLCCLKSLDTFHYREMDWVLVKGKTEPLSIYEVYDMDSVEIRKQKRKSNRFISKGLYERHTRQWEQAINTFRKSLDIYPEDIAVHFHISQCEYFQKNPPAEDWNGASVFLSK
ncbi:adenylate/guanylate cyclase domain-containing protein [Deltaproteobacteria bacterium TL4]